ncbi:MAG: methyltransferase family protein [Ignavibacteriales bacterium]
MSHLAKEGVISMTGQGPSPNERAGIGKRFTQAGITLGFEAGILFAASGRLDWLWAWVFLALYLAGMAVIGSLLLRHSPETIARRASGEGAEGWEKVVGGLWSLVYFAGLPFVAGIDVRYAWTGQLPLAAHLAGVVFFVIGFGFFIWAMVSNAHFSTVARVQRDGNHKVCTTGPYRYVRHPGYSGMIVQTIAMPLLLGSLWALIPGATASLLMIVRTVLEDRMLIQKLNGYAKYARRVRYRLAPGIW